MKSCSEIMLSRRSVKKYTDKEVPKEIIDKVIEAGLAAASGRNLQAPIIVAVTNKEIRDKLSAANAAVMGASGDPFYNAPVVLVVLAEKRAHTYVYDGSLALGNMMLAAHEAGIGSCWIHRAREVFEMPEWQAWLRSVGVSEEVEGIGHLVIGYPDGEMPAAKERRPGRVFFVE